MDMDLSHRSVQLLLLLNLMFHLMLQHLLMVRAFELFGQLRSLKEVQSLNTQFRFFKKITHSQLSHLVRSLQ